MKRNSVKTIAIFSGYHLPHLGGIERYTNNLALELRKSGIKVVIVTSNYANLKQEELINGIQVLRIPIYNIFTNRYPIPKKNDEYKKIIKKLDLYNIDSIIVNTRFHLTSLVGAKYGKKNNIPVFLIEHGSEHLTVDNKILDFFGAIYEHMLTSYIKKFVNQYYGVSKEACNWQKHFKINSNGVWYNSINDFSKNITLKKNKEMINILYAGRILKQKGIIELLNSFIECQKNNDNITLYIAGDGNLLPEIKKKYKNDNIKFMGKLDFEELKKLYSITDIFVYAPMWPEGLPTSILEAGLMKCSVIATPFGGTKEVIENNRNGILIKNENELKNSLNKLINDQDLRIKLSNNLYKTVKDKFIWEKTAKKIIDDINNYIMKKEKSND